MSNKDLIKKLTSKNKTDYEPVAHQLINTPDISLFEELVNQDDFLFDFVKRNVSQRLQNACNASNYRNLLALMKVYSPFYEDFIASTLAKFADEDLTDELLEIFENGTEAEKTYCAKYFSHIKDPLALEFLRESAFSENENLSSNCAATLGAFEDKESFELALNKLDSDDDFEIFKGVNFLIAYGDKTAAKKIIEVLDKSSMAENIAGEIPYLIDLFSILELDTVSGLTVINYIINGLGEILPLSTTIDYNLYSVIEDLANNSQNSAVATVLTNAREKFNTLTENDEYLFDEDKNTKNEVYEIKELLNNIKICGNIDEELRADSPFVFTALDFTTNAAAAENLLSTDNQTLVLKAAEILKKLGGWNDKNRTNALENVTDSTIRAIIEALQ